MRTIDISPNLSEVKFKLSLTHTLQMFTTLLEGILKKRNN
jgi:hypothetical protein